jgi:hypothetical protein
MLKIREDISLCSYFKEHLLEIKTKQNKTQKTNKQTNKNPWNC